MKINSKHLLCLALLPGLFEAFPAFTLKRPGFQLLLSRRSIQQRSILGSSSSGYKRGAEIWPDCNEEPIQLKESFPGNVVPNDALAVLNGGEKKESTPSLPTSRNPIARFFLGGMSKNRRLGVGKFLGQSPASIASLLLLRGLVRFSDVLVVVVILGYAAVLVRVAGSTRADGLSPVMPSVPPHGHIPDLVANPLGYSFTHSEEYDSWLRAGVLLSLFLPFLVVLRCVASQNLLLAEACARPLFLLCCQAVGESLSRRILAPLPIRILIPVCFNAIRLGPIWSWIMTPMGLFGQLLANLNLLYWVANLFGYLLPVATVRYFRAYFFCVEAEQVVTRPGFEDGAGVLS